MALERAENAERSKGTEISSMLSKYNREMADLEEALRVSICQFMVYGDFLVLTSV
jgi:hypothetical protein